MPWPDLPTNVHDTVGIRKVGISGVVFIRSLKRMSELVRNREKPRGRPASGVRGTGRNDIHGVELDLSTCEIDVAPERRAPTSSRHLAHSYAPMPHARDPTNVEVDRNPRRGDMLTEIGVAADLETYAVALDAPYLPVDGIVELPFLLVCPGP